MMARWPGNVWLRADEYDGIEYRMDGYSNAGLSDLVEDLVTHRGVLLIGMGLGMLAVAATVLVLSPFVSIGG